MTDREQHSLYFIYWTGGGMPPVGATGQTIGAFSLEELMERVGEKLGRKAADAVHPDAPDVTVRDGAVHISDVPMGLWPMLDDWEDVTDAAA